MSESCDKRLCRRRARGCARMRGCVGEMRLVMRLVLVLRHSESERRDVMLAD